MGGSGFPADHATQGFQIFWPFPAWLSENLPIDFEGFSYDFDCNFLVIDIQKRRDNVLYIESATAFLDPLHCIGGRAIKPDSILDAISKALTGLSIQQSC